MSTNLVCKGKLEYVKGNKQTLHREIPPFQIQIQFLFVTRSIIHSMTCSEMLCNVRPLNYNKEMYKIYRFYI